MPVTPVTIGGIACHVDPEDYSESWPGEGGPEIRVTYRCPDADRYTVVNALMGTVSYSGSIARIAPLAFPRSPNLYAVSIGDIKRIGNPRVAVDGFFDYDDAYIPVLYAVPKISFDSSPVDPAGGFVDPSGQPWTTTTINVSSDVIKPPKGSYYFVGSSPATPVEEGSLGFLFPQVEITLKRHRYPYLPLAELMALVGKTNNASMKFGNYTFPAEYLLCAAGPSSQDVDTTGQQVTSLEVKLLGRSQSWNKLPNKTGAWTDINTNVAGTGTKPYPTADFSLLP